MAVTQNGAFTASLADGYKEVRSKSDLQTKVVTGIALAIVSASCSTEHATYAPDGRRAYVVTCGGYLNDWGSCLVKAGRACGNRGYDTIQGQEEDRRLLIACKPQ